MRSGGRNRGGVPEQSSRSVQSHEHGAADGPGVANMISVNVPGRMNCDRLLLRFEEGAGSMVPTRSLPERPRRDCVVAGVVFVATFAIFLASPVRPLGDSHYSMLLSEHLLTRRSFTLDEHFRVPLDPARYPGINGSRGAYPYQIEIVGAHVYYFFPVGSSILSVPFVAVTRAVGVSAMGPDGVYDQQGERRIQTVLASFLMATLAAFFFATARLVLPVGWSLVGALVGALGTQVWTTAALALWSDTWGIFLLGAVVWMLLAHEAHARPLRARLLATLVAWMYIVRPTNVLVVIAVGVYLFARDRRRLRSYLVVGGLWLAALIAYSWVHFHRPLPNYYMARQMTFERFWTPLAAHLVSPGRGLFVYVPVGLFVLWLAVHYRRALSHRSLVAVAGSVIVAHLVLISGFSLWHAGQAYGPRYATGIVPWLFLLAVLGLRAMLDSGPLSRPALTAGAVLAALSVVIQYRGAWVPATWEWNSRPPIETHADEKVWNWRAPQFAASPSRTQAPPGPLVK
jgi:hypothetical protein